MLIATLGIELLWENSEGFRKPGYFLEQLERMLATLEQDDKLSKIRWFNSLRMYSPGTLTHGELRLLAT